MHSYSQIIVDWSGALLAGALTTIEMAIAAYLLALVLGILGALAKRSDIHLLRLVVGLYTTIMRAVPELLLIIILFYAGQDLVNTLISALGASGSIRFSAFWTAVTVLAIVDGAYLTEIFRGSIQAIPRGHIEAADAFGMSRWLRFRRVVLPEMLPTALPSMYNIFLILLKDTALVSVVGAQELFFTAQQAAASTRAYFLLYTAAGVVYLAMTLFSNVLFRWLERRYDHNSHSAQAA